MNTFHKEKVSIKSACLVCLEILHFVHFLIIKHPRATLPRSPSQKWSLATRWQQHRLRSLPPYASFEPKQPCFAFAAAIEKKCISSPFFAKLPPSASLLSFTTAQKHSFLKLPWTNLAYFYCFRYDSKWFVPLTYSSMDRISIDSYISAYQFSAIFYFLHNLPSLRSFICLHFEKQKLEVARFARKVGNSLSPDSEWRETLQVFFFSLSCTCVSPSFPRRIQ